MPLNFLDKMKESAAKANAPTMMFIPGPIPLEAKKALEKAKANGQSVIVVEPLAPFTPALSPTTVIGMAKHKWSPDEKVSGALELLASVGLKPVDVEIMIESGSFDHYEHFGLAVPSHLINKKVTAEINFTLTDDAAPQIAAILQNQIKGVKW